MHNSTWKFREEFVTDFELLLVRSGTRGKKNTILWNAAIVNGRIKIELHMQSWEFLFCIRYRNTVILIVYLTQNIQIVTYCSIRSLFERLFPSIEMRQTQFVLFYTLNFLKSVYVQKSTFCHSTLPTTTSNRATYRLDQRSRA